MLVGRNGADVSAKSFADLTAKRIAIVEGYAYGPELDSAHGPVFVRVKSSQESLRAVVAGQVDYCLLDALLVEYLFEHHLEQAKQHLAVGSTALVRRTLHFALRKAVPDAARIIARFNEVVSDMVRDGTYNLALEVTWISADVDGDGRYKSSRPAPSSARLRRRAATNCSKARPRVRVPRACHAW